MELDKEMYENKTDNSYLMVETFNDNNAFLLLTVLNILERSFGTKSPYQSIQTSKPNLVLLGL